MAENDSKGGMLPHREADSPLPGMLHQAEGGTDPVLAPRVMGSRAPREYWHALTRMKVVVAALAGVGLLAGLAAYAIRIPMFRSTATVELLPPGDDATGSARSGSASSKPSIDTQVRILQSGPLQRKVFDSLKDREQRIASQPSHAQQWLARVRLDRLIHQPKPTYTEALRAAGQNLTVQPVPDTSLIEISTSSPDPHAAADYVNALMEEFIVHHADGGAVSTQGAGELLQQQIEAAKANLDRSEAALQAYSRTVGAGLSTQSSLAAEDSLKAIQRQYAGARMERVERQAKTEMAMDAPLARLPDMLSDPLVRELDTKIAELRRQLNQMLLLFTPAHPDVEKTQRQIADLEAQQQKEQARVQAMVQGANEEAEKRERLLARTVATQSAMVADQTRKRNQYDLLKREADANRVFYESLQRRSKEMMLGSTIRASRIRVIEPPVTPSSPTEPTLPRTAGFGALGGLGLGLVYVVLRQTADRSVRGPGDGASYINVPELGVIPNAAAIARAVNGSPVLLGLRRSPAGTLEMQPEDPERDVELVTWRHKPSPLAESFRSAVTSLLFTNRTGDLPKVVLLTSPLPSEGKTTVASNLAIALAEIGQRVLLIDGDMRGTRLHNIFSVANTWGLSDLLQDTQDPERLPLEALVRPTAIPNLHVLPSGPATNQIARLLFSSRPQQLLLRLRRDYDRILIDTPPVLSFADARVLGKVADGAILVLRAGRSRKEDALQAAQTLRMDGTMLLGTILNDWDRVRDSSRYGKYQYEYGA